MKKAVIALTLGIMLIAGNLFAQGDLIVEGDLDVGGEFRMENDNATLVTKPGYAGWASYSQFLVGNSIEVIRGRGSVASPLPVASNSMLFTYELYAQYDATSAEHLGRFGAAMTSTDGLPAEWTAKVFFDMHEVELGSAKTTKVTMPYGNVGIGTDTPQYPLDMGDGAYSDGFAWLTGSSKEYKENIETLSADDALNALKDLNPVTFNYKTIKDDTQVGFIAEDVPELVATKTRKAISSMDIVAVLTRVVKEQQKTISELTEKVSNLDKQMKLNNSIAMATPDLK